MLQQFRRRAGGRGAGRAAPAEDDELGVAPRAVRRKTKAHRKPEDTVLDFLQP